MDDRERELLSESVLATCTGHDEPDQLDPALLELGWLEMLRSEPHDATAVVFRALGSTNATASVLDDVVVAALGLEPGPDVAVLVPPFGVWHRPGTLDGSRCSAQGIAGPRVATARELLVVCAGSEHARVVRVPTASAHVRRIDGVDPSAGLRAVRVDHGADDAMPLGPGTWEAAVAGARVALAHQLAGGCRSMLEHAREHALDRVQFDRPIARFQAVRHRLAEALVAVDAADATARVALDEPGDLTAALAKAVAGRSAATVGAHCQQVLAGIGFTTDHPFHRLLKRSMVLDGLFGSTDAVTVDVGRRLLAERRVPTLVEL